jgi:hypothetical protein
MSVAADTQRRRRVDASSSFVAAVLIVGGFSLLGGAPLPADVPREIGRQLWDDRALVLASAFLIGTGSLFFLWFLAAVQEHLRRAQPGDAALAALSFLAGGAAMVLVVTGVAVQAALVLQENTTRSAGAVRLGFDAYNGLVTIAGLPFAAYVAAASESARRSRALPSALWRFGWATAALQLLTLPGLVVTDGAFAPGQAVALVAFLVLTAWSVAVGVVLFRRAGPSH